MSHHFNLKFNEMRENNPTDENADGVTPDSVNYPTPSNGRNICFVWPNGKQTALNYSYLVLWNFDPEQNRIDLIFTTHSVTITGIKLNDLFNNILMGITRKVIAIDKRYAGLESNGVVTDIVLTAL